MVIGDAFYLLLNIHGGLFFVLKFPYTWKNLRSYVIKNVPGLVDLHSFWQLLTCKYIVMALNCEHLVLKLVVINERKSNGNLTKIFAGKNLRKKHKNRFWRGVLKMQNLNLKLFHHGQIYFSTIDVSLFIRLFPTIRCKGNLKPEFCQQNWKCKVT